MENHTLNRRAFVRRSAPLAAGVPPALAKLLALAHSTEQLRAGEYLPWRSYVTTCLDTLIEYGADRFGPIHTGMLMGIIDVRKRESPEKPLFFDGQVHDEGHPQCRNPAGSNLWYDQATIRVMYRLSELTGDPKYAKAADRYINDVFKYAVKANGLPVWGSHIFYDAYADKPGGDGDGKGPHEILVYHPKWAQLYREATSSDGPPRIGPRHSCLHFP